MGEVVDVAAVRRQRAGRLDGLEQPADEGRAARARQAPHEHVLAGRPNAEPEPQGVDGVVLTKLDGTAKGGVIVGLADEFGIPVKHVGVGEAVEDLVDRSDRALYFAKDAGRDYWQNRKNT